jgi:hypothetical protein
VILRRNFLRAVAFAALGAAVTASCGGGKNPPSAASTTLPATSTTPTSVEAQGPTAPYTWVRDTKAALSLGGGPTTTISGVLPPTPGSPTWIVAGTSEAANGGSIAKVWTSTNATAWTETPLSAPNVASQAMSAVQWNTSTIVVGAVGPGGTERAAAWIASSPTGPYAQAPVTGNQAGSSLIEVTGGSLGMFALGTSGGQIALWSSTNGLDWTPSDSFDDLIATSVDPHVDAVLAVGNNVYAAGSVSNGTETDAALWTSADGINWHRVESAQAAFGGPGMRSITGLAQLGSGLVAVGGIRTAGAWSPASWISPDGASWSQPSEAFPMGARPHEDVDGSIARAVSAVGTLQTTTQLLAVGGSSGAQRVWQSSNGLSWSEIPLPLGAAASADWQASLVGTEGATTVVADSDPGQPYVLTYGPGGWGEPSSNAHVFGAVEPVAQPVSLTAAGNKLTLVVDVDTPPQAIGESSTTRTVLITTDGSTWGAASALTGPASLPSGASAAVRFKGRWVAVGQAAGADATSAATDNPSDLAVYWNSPDGVHWSDRGPLDTRPGIGPQDPTGVCVTPGSATQVVAVGSGDQFPAGQEALAWASTDGTHWIRAEIDPPTLTGGSQEMTGCLTTASGLVAYGGTTASSGITTPALWKSQTGLRWARQEDGLGSGTASPLTYVAHSGSRWVAVAAQPAGVGMSASGLWLSQDGGSTWLPVDTLGSPWQVTGTAQLDLAGFAADGPVVIGTVDGRLAVWLGTPAATPQLTPVDGVEPPAS